jgi:ubiquinone/menaquinone biosynthesis C-methylase UbiE
MSKPSQLSKEYQEAIGPAAEYEQVKVPKLFEPAARIFLSHVSVQPMDRVLDVACGTGIVARVVAEQDGFAGQITGLDLDPNMLAVARSKTPSSGIDIEYQEGDALDLPFDSDSFDLVLCQQGIQYFSDKSAALRSIHRVLVSGGRVAILVAASINPKHQPRKWAEMEALRKHAGDEEAKKELHPGYFEGGTGLLRTMVSDAGFRNVEVEVLVETWGPMGTLEQLIPEKKYSNLEPKTQEVVVKDIREAMRPYDKGRDTQLPIGFYLASGHK